MLNHETQPGYLHPGTLQHVRRNLYDCANDPGELESAEVDKAASLHRHCSTGCRVRQRLAATHTTGHAQRAT